MKNPPAENSRGIFFQMVISRLVQHVGTVEAQGLVAFAAIFGEHRAGGDNGQHQGVDERVRRQSGDSASQIGIYDFRRGDRKNLLIFVRRNVFGFEDTDQADLQVEGLGFSVRGFHFHFEGNEIEFIVFLNAADGTGELGFDLEFRISVHFHPIHRVGKFFGSNAS